MLDLPLRVLFPVHFGNHFALSRYQLSVWQEIAENNLFSELITEQQISSPNLCNKRAAITADS